MPNSFAGTLAAINQGDQLMSQAAAYALLQQVMVDPGLVQRLDSDPSTVFAQAGITDPTEQQQLLTVLRLMWAGSQHQTELGQAQQKQQLDMVRAIGEQSQATMDVASELKSSLRKTLDQIDRAYRSTMLMYQISFYLGVALILVAVVMAVTSKEALLPIVFGTLGTLDILTFFLVKPQEQLQNSRASLAQLQAGLYNWFMDSFNQHTFLGLLQQQGKIDAASMQQVSQALMSNTNQTLDMLQKYCKLVHA